MARRRGKNPIAETVRYLVHPSRRLLAHIRKSGVPAKTSFGPWPAGRLEAAIHRGPHPSAKLHREFLLSEMVEMWKKGQAALLPISVARQLEFLMLSPPASIEQRGRRNRNLLDLTYSGVNGASLRLAPREAMQFGTALRRLLHAIFHADPRHGPVKLLKNDLSDGFFRLPINPDDIPRLASILPLVDGWDEPLVMFHLSAPMGWTESPPWFSVLTETVADVVNQRMARGYKPPPHRLEAVADTPAPGRPSLAEILQLRPSAPMSLRYTPRPGGPMAVQEVYVDDFISAAQGPRSRLLRMRRILLHAVDEVFTFDANEKEPSSVKKMRKGDASWDTLKEVLGWVVNTLAGTIELPDRRKERLAAILDEYPRSRRRVQVSKWQSFIGEVRSMALAIPGLAGCFSVLQQALDPSARRVKLSAAVHDQIDDIRWLAADLSSRPTRIAEIIQGPADYVGTADACGTGLGGVWLPYTRHPLSQSPIPPTVFRLRLPADIQRRLVTFDNPKGDINMGELELAARVLGDLLLTSITDVREANVVVGSDSTNATAWHTRQSVTSSGPRALLLRLNALAKRHFRYQSHTVYIPGPVNTMADDASRLWHLNDSQLVSYFNSRYPQSKSWQLSQPPTAMRSALISCLRSGRVAPGAIFRAPGPGITSGKSGVSFATPSTSPSSYRMSTTPFPSFWPSWSDIATVGSPSNTIQYLLGQWKMLRGRSEKRSKHWGPRTYA